MVIELRRIVGLAPSCCATGEQLCAGSNVWYCSQESQIPARFLPGMFELPELPLPLRQGKQDIGTAPTWGKEHPKARSSCRTAQMCVRRKLISKLILKGSGWTRPDINPRKEQADLPWSCGLRSMLVSVSRWVLLWPRLLAPRKPLGQSCPEPSASQGFQGNQESSQHRSSFRHHIFPSLNWQLELQCAPPRRETAQKADVIDFGKSEAAPLPSVLVASLRRTAITTGVAVWPFGGAACFGGGLVMETSV